MATADGRTYWLREFELDWFFRGLVPPWEDDVSGAPATNYQWNISNFKFALHAASPGGAGGLGTNPIVYTGYAMANWPRGSAYWRKAGTNSQPAVTPLNTVAFPKNTGGTSPAASHVSIGFDDGAAFGYGFAACEGGAFVCTAGRTPILSSSNFAIYGRNDADN